MRSFFLRKPQKQLRPKRHGAHSIIVFTFLCILYSSASSARVYSQTSVPFLIPRQIYVGDPAALVVPLSLATMPKITVTTDLPAHDYIDFHKITLQQDRLIIEFTAFIPGLIEFPIIEIGGHYFPNLSVNVNSIIEKNSVIALSAPASSLSMPGTAAMLYGFISGIVFLLFISIWFAVKGRKLAAVWKKKWERWRVFTNMRQTERRLNKALLKGHDNRIILNKLSCEFRVFLSILLNKNCRAMTAYEIGRLQPVLSETGAASVSLENFFARCDSYRFSGTQAGKEDIMQLLKELRRFIEEAEHHEF